MQLTLRSLSAILFPVTLTLLTYILAVEQLEQTVFIGYLAAAGVGFILSIFSAMMMSKAASSPVTSLEQAISYAANNARSEEVPTQENVRIGRELIQSLTLQVYDLASMGAPSQPQAASEPTVTTPEPETPQTTQVAPSNSTLMDAINTPIIGIDADQKVTVANKAAGEYLGLANDQMIGKSVYDCIALSFQGDETFEDWLKKSKESSVTATRSWERVRHVIDQDTFKQFDMVASFSSGSSSGTETMMAIFDRSARYDQDDQEISFVALAVHELRTPLTIMRGYIEVFEDELGPTLSPELQEFMHKMHASAQQLAAFVGNILNVARVEENQLSLKLRSESIKEILDKAIEDLELRAKVHGKHIELAVAENLPAVGADRISIHEVINNLVDNAIKYSGDAPKIRVNANINSEGRVQVDVQDYGIGIPTSVMSELFKKFHRSHKSRVQVGGTGLGLYLCKALVNAHGGNIWVHSKEGEGSIFSFTLLPYDQVSDGEADGEDGIVRGAHGWIKNHSLYRN